MKGIKTGGRKKGSLNKRTRELDKAAKQVGLFQQPASARSLRRRPMSLLTLQMPALPDPVKVVLQPATTTLLVFDMIDSICKNQPNCT